MKDKTRLHKVFIGSRYKG